jgi:hypothetical protein
VSRAFSSNARVQTSRASGHGCHNDWRARESLFAAGDSATFSLQILDAQVDVETIGMRRCHDAIEVRDDITNRRVAEATRVRILAYVRRPAARISCFPTINLSTTNQSEERRMRLSPESLRKSRYELRSNKPAKTVIQGEQLLVAILAMSERPVHNRRSFWEIIADYNPIDQFGAAQGRFLERGGADDS